MRSKRDEAAAAKDLYTSPLFAKRRRYAEASGVRWYILSGRLGLLRPDEVIAPYELALGAMSARYRAAWGAFVVAQLAEVEHLAQLTGEVHAGDVYIDALRGPLESTGANVVDPVEATSLGATLAWYDRVWHAPPTASPSATHALSTHAAVSAAVAEASVGLGRTSNADTDSAYVRFPKASTSGSGVVHTTSCTSRGPSPVYAGQAGATRWPSGPPSTKAAAPISARVVRLSP